jgi:hypothetical protein
MRECARVRVARRWEKLPGVQVVGYPYLYPSNGFLWAMADDAGFSEAKERALEYETYEDYLNSQITERDLYYLEVRVGGTLCGTLRSFSPSPGNLSSSTDVHLRFSGYLLVSLALSTAGVSRCVMTDAAAFPIAQDEEVARQLVELGYHTVGETLKREEFEARKKAEREKHLHKDNVAKPLASVGKDLSDTPFLQCLASREELVRNGKLTVSSPPRLLARFLWRCGSSLTFAAQCIIFIRDVNAKGQEVSGYIDYAHRLATEKFELYFEGKRKLMPKPSDLSYFNWETHASTSNSSPNFQVRCWRSL